MMCILQHETQVRVSGLNDYNQLHNSKGYFRCNHNHNMTNVNFLLYCNYKFLCVYIRKKTFKCAQILVVNLSSMLVLFEQLLCNRFNSWCLAVWLQESNISFYPRCSWTKIFYCTYFCILALILHYLIEETCDVSSSGGMSLAIIINSHWHIWTPIAVGSVDWGDTNGGTHWSWFDVAVGMLYSM